MLRVLEHLLYFETVVVYVGYILSSQAEVISEQIPRFMGFARCPEFHRWLRSDYQVKPVAVNPDGMQALGQESCLGATRAAQDSLVRLNPHDKQDMPSTA